MLLILWYLSQVSGPFKQRLRMEIIVDDRVASVLSEEAKSRGLDLNELIDQILRTAAMRSNHNNGRINQAEVPSGLM